MSEDDIILRDKEQEIYCVMYLKYKDTFTPEYPKSLDVEEYYIDQAMYNVNAYGRRITSFYTPFGIKQIDSWLSKQIRNESKYSKIELEQLIKRNPHLHNVIKTNLLDNLKNIQNGPLEY